MKIMEKSSQLFLLNGRVEKVHKTYSDLRSEGHVSVKISKEEKEYENAQELVMYARIALHRARNKRVSLGRWAAVAAATLSVENYLAEYDQ